MIVFLPNRCLYYALGGQSSPAINHTGRKEIKTYDLWLNRSLTTEVEVEEIYEIYFECFNGQCLKITMLYFAGHVICIFVASKTVLR